MPFKAEATYCDFELNPQISATQIIYNYTMNASNSSVIDNTTYTTMILNIAQFNRLSNGQYIANYSFNNTNNLTNSTTNAYISFICNETKNFFIINASNYALNVKPNETINFNFIISPVKFGSYIINSWGLFAIPETSANISNPLYYTRNVTVPDIERGTYRQVFQITNGKESQYLFYQINNTGLIRPKILKPEIPAKLTYGIAYNISFVVDNVDSMFVETYRDNTKVDTYNLIRKSDYLFEGSSVPLELLDTLKVGVVNNYTTQFISYNISTAKIDYTQNDVIMPSLLVNYTSFLEIIDFKTDVPISLKIESEIVPLNSSDNTTKKADVDYYFSNEIGTSNPASAKKLMIYINPKNRERGQIAVNISSPAFEKKSFNIYFLGGTFNNQQVMDIDYYSKKTHCVIKQSAGMQFDYDCTFTLPSDYDVKNLQNNEISLIKDGCNAISAAKDDTISKGSRNYNMLLGFNILVVLGLIGYYISTRTRFRIG